MTQAPVTPPSPPDLSHVETWIFDLDNTLYPAACNLFAQVDQRMGEFISTRLDLEWAAARAIQKQYFREYGTTLRGLMTVHDIDPHAFLDYVHDIDVSGLPSAETLDAALGALSGRKIVYTNGSVAHAERVMGQLGIGRHFDGIEDIVSAAFEPKPNPAPYSRLIDRRGIDPRRAAMVEDIAKNLKPAHALGITTIWVDTGSGWAAPEADAAYVDHVVHDLPDWLTGVAGLR